MKLIVAFVSLAVACVLGAGPDPTKICLPEDYGRVAIDFKKELLAINYVKAELRIVINLTNYEGSAINITDGKCVKISASGNIANVVTRCLPASAKLLTNASNTIGIAPNQVSIQGWEIDVGTGITRVALTTGASVVPVIREYNNGKTKDVAFYSNQKLTLTDEKIFEVPDDCAPSTVVG
ncbi:hypothetical protein BsWGS_04500 [Bradybaena similaris]